MKKSIKLALSLIILISLAMVLTGCGTNSDVSNSNSNPNTGPDFIEVGETYTLEGHFSESGGTGIQMFVIKAEILDKDSNWVKVGKMEPGGNYTSISSELRTLWEEREDWNHIWLNLDHVMGITK